MDDFTDRSQFRIGDLMVVPASLVVVRNGQEIKFEPRWMQVLVMLAEHAGETLSTERLLIEVWGSAIYGDSPVSKTISYIRKSIGDDSRKPRYIETVSKVGYKLIEPVSLPEDYRRMPSELWTRGSPYVGLSAFDADHASVFCGRSRIVADLLRAMRSQIENQRRFVLMVGASGCGKTSLLRAGAIPLLIKPDGFDGLRALSVTTCDLAANGSDPLIPLATALAQWTLGDRPVFPPQTTDQLKALLTDTPEMIAGFISEALRRHFNSDLDEQPYAHLLLTVDHAEALVSTTDIDANERDAFARVLQSLCACPHVLVTMITRGDFYLKLIETLPALAECKAGDGHLDVIAPRYGEIGEIIRSPAWKADLSFETDPETRTRLDDALRDAALSQPDALPLLQHTLQALYERLNDQRQLTFAAYNDIGGLEGAVAHRAEQVFATLPVNAQASLDTVLTKLIVIQPDSDAVSGRRTSIDTFDADARTLVDAFTTARLFVRDHYNGQPTVGVVHEALLRRWPRAVEWTQDNRRLLQAKARLQHAANRWDDEGRRDDHLLNPGRPLIEAREVEQRYVEDIGEVEIALLRASERMDRRKRLLSRIAIGALAALSIISTSLAIMATRASFIAERNRNEALDLIGYMLVELSDQLRPTASTAPMKSISTRALKFLERQDVDDMAPGDLINYSRALRTRGEVMSIEEKDASAKALFERADAMAQRAMKMQHTSTQAIAEAGQTAFWLGTEFNAAGKSDEAMAEWTHYLQHTEELLTLDPNNPDWWQEHAYATANLGYLDQQRGDCASAMLKFKAAIREMERAIGEKPDADSWRFNWIVARSMTSRCQAQDGRIMEASRGYFRQIVELEALLRRRPDAIDWEQQLASLLHFNASLSASLGRIDDAETQYLEAVDRLTTITKIQPSDQSWKRGLANSLTRAADIAYLRGDADAATTRLRIAMRLVEAGQAAEDGSRWRRLSAMILFRIGRYGASSDSERNMSAGIESLRALVNAKPEDTHAKAALADALISRGTWLRDAGRLADARGDWNAAKSTMGRIATSTSNPDMLAPWVNANMLLGHRAEAEASIRTLTASGYAHPDFVALESNTR
jgi:eukaryotic-like serine/threonine-protein kinase